MRNFKIYLMSALLLAGVFGCNNFDEDINIDPNNVSAVPTAYLLTAAQRDLVGRILNVSGFDEYGILYTQQIAQKTYTGLERYDGSPESSFNDWYADGNYNLVEVIRLNTDEETKAAAMQSGPNENQIAVAKILLSWSYMNLTDIWGSIPYSEALLGRENFTPSYDTQEAVYTGIIADLKEAAAMIVPGDIDGDAIYNGDMDKWKKFAGGLLMRIGLRLSNVDAAMGQDAFTSGMNIGTLESNDDDALYVYAGGENNPSPYYYAFNLQNRLDYSVSHVLIAKMGSLNDPRIHSYATPVEQILSSKPDLAPQSFWDKYVSANVTVDGVKYAGQPYGYNQNTATIIGTSNVSYVGEFFRDETTPSVLLSYSETLFSMAEAVEKSWISGDAEQLYEEAITASMEYYGVDGARIASYLAQPEVAYDAANYLESIQEQKWLASYLQGLNVWAEWRRTGIPMLEAAPDAAEGRDIPRRRAYSQTEFDLNKENYEAAVQQMGGNTTAESVWWDGGN